MLNKYIQVSTTHRKEKQYSLFECDTYITTTECYNILCWYSKTLNGKQIIIGGLTLKFYCKGSACCKLPSQP